MQRLAMARPAQAHEHGAVRARRAAPQHRRRNGHCAQALQAQRRALQRLGFELGAQALGDRPATRSFHRPLSTYVNGLSAEGFAVDAMLEIPDTLDERRPAADRAGNRAAAEIPLFLALRARR